jgi:uncharacterized protein YaiI (UPF0178 family)
MLDLFVDVDCRPVLPQVLRAAERYLLELYVVTRDYVHADANVHLILAQEDEANSGAWIAANIRPGDICITGDPRLASSCILRGAQALSPAGRLWCGDSAGVGVIGAVPNPRSFTQRLEATIIAARATGRLPFATMLPRFNLAGTSVLRR